MDKSSKTAQIYKPKDVKILNFGAMAMPGKLVGNYNLIIHGLGDNGLIYSYRGGKNHCRYAQEIDTIY